MDRRVTARANMFNTVARVCENNTAKVALIPAFALLVNRLGDFIKEVSNLMQLLSVKSGGAALSKNEWKERLSLLLSVVCGAGISYGKKISDTELVRLFSYQESALTHLRDTELIEVAANLIVLQEKHATPLAEYGINTETMADVKTALDRFKEKNPAPVADIYESEAERDALLTKVFEVSDFVLNDFMEAAKIYKLRDLIFYNSLDNASRISQVGIRHEKPEEDETVSRQLKSAKAELKRQEKAERKLKLEERRAQEKIELEHLTAELLNRATALRQLQPLENGVMAG